MSIRTLAAAALVVGLLGACGQSSLDQNSTDGPSGEAQSDVTTSDTGRDGATTAVDRSEPAQASTTEPEPTTDPTQETPTTESPVTTSTPQSDDQPVPTTQPATSTTGGRTGGLDIDPALESIVEAAISDLASRLGIGSESIEVKRAETVVWPDTSLGCPVPGMAYSQVTTDGSRVLLVADGAEYHYHTGGSRSEPFLCETPMDS